MTSAFIYSFREMTRQSGGSDGRGKKRQGLSNGEDTSNTSKKERDRGGGGERERVCTCSVVNVSCKLEQECIMEV